MNSCGLRIGASDSKKAISGIAFKPVLLPDNYKLLAEKHELLKYFMNSSAEEQVTAVKKLLNSIKEHCDNDLVFFLVVTFLYADVKHPVKCIITRFVTKNEFIQKPFTAVLFREVLTLIHQPHMDYKTYVKVIGKIASCTENFPVGAIALKNIEMALMTYLTDSLTCCISTLSDKLTPTGRNEVYGLAHTVLRLLLHVIQKVDEGNIEKCISMYADIRSGLRHLMFDDSPMDTKSVCGIVFVSMHVMENGPDSWAEILDSKMYNSNLQEFLSNDMSKLSLYSAIATMISMEKLHSHYIQDQPAIIHLTENIMDLGDRYSSESIFILAVARTIVQISKGLDRSEGGGLHLLDRLLIFVWSNLEHNTDSIQHLSVQILTNVVKFCAHLKKQGDDGATNELLKTLSSLERTRKSFYLGLTALTDELGTECVLTAWPDVIAETMDALHLQAVRASATTALETMLRRTHTHACGLYARWVEPALRCVRAGGGRRGGDHEGGRQALAALMTTALEKEHALVEYIVPHIRLASERSDPGDLRCVLMLSHVLRQAGLLAGDSGDSAAGPSGDIMRAAAVHDSEEIRVLSISLIVESPRSTETFTEEELDFVLWFISYNINAREPHFKQLVLSLMKKFFKRLEQSYRTLRRENLPDSTVNKGESYLHFSDKLTDLCFSSLEPGGNHNRRHVALQMLEWLGRLDFENVDRQNFHILKENNEAEELERVSTLLDILGDNYESNKELALQLLSRCRSDVLYNDKYASTLSLESVIEQASSMKPTECVTAGYKLKLITRKLPTYIDENRTTGSEASLAAVLILSEHLLRQVRVCSHDLARGSRRAPMYGVLHCLGLALDDTDSTPWSDALAHACVSLVSLCERVCLCAAPVLNSAAPEGHLPDSHQGKIRFEDGSEVTAQMVLLCAWRSVKEVSSILSVIVSKVTASPNPNFKISLVTEIGETFLRLLTETKHRGAFEQVYVGFGQMLTSLWRDPEPQLSELPERWLSDLMSSLESGRSASRLCASRRSAGLPYMIQALVVSRLRASPGWFPSCASSLLRAARTAGVETRCHCINVLRALYRSAAVGGAGAGVGVGGAGLEDALMLAVQGCESDAWLERNSSTLLFSSLMVRVFGVRRSRDGRLCERNKMTGRIFFLRYPRLYDFMLDKLRQANSHVGLQSALFPVLLLLARLYPSALEGSVSILKLSCFVPYVCRCSCAWSLPLRLAGARALPPLLDSPRYLSHLEEMFTSLGDRSIKRNSCHGILLQIITLVDEMPKSLAVDAEFNNKLSSLVESTSWILWQGASDAPCYLIADEYIKLIHIILWRCNPLFKKSVMNNIRECLTKLLFDKNNCKINPGRELCLANAVYLYFILNIYDTTDNIRLFVFKCLAHDTYEVVLAVLNYLLIIYKELEPENMLQEHLKEKSNTFVLESLKHNDRYIEALCHVLWNSEYLECTTKCLEVLTLEPDTQKHIVLTESGDSEISDEQIMMKLFDYIESVHENFTHIYLKSLTSFLSAKLNSVSHLMILKAVRILFSCSLSDNDEDTRAVVMDFLENNLEILLNFKFNELGKADTFEARATLWSTCVSLLEDDETHTRARIAHTITRACDVTRTRNTHVIPSRAMDFLLEYIKVHEPEAVAMLTVIALTSFDREVYLTDDVTDECRVFDHNEKYNTDQEDTMWSYACAYAVKDIYEDTDVTEHVCDILDHATYKQTFDALCGDNVDAYKRNVKRSTL